MLKKFAAFIRSHSSLQYSQEASHGPFGVRMIYPEHLHTHSVTLSYKHTNTSAKPSLRLRFLDPRNPSNRDLQHAEHISFMLIRVTKISYEISNYIIWSYVTTRSVTYTYGWSRVFPTENKLATCITLIEIHYR